MADHIARWAAGIVDLRNSTTASVGQTSTPISTGIIAIGPGFVIIRNLDGALPIDCDVSDSEDGTNYTVLSDSVLKLAEIAAGTSRRYELPLPRRKKLRVRGLTGVASSVSTTVEVYSAVGS